MIDNVIGISDNSYIIISERYLLKVRFMTKLMK